MSRHRWRESLQSLRENHIDPEEYEQLKLSKIEIQNKVSKALKLANERRPNRKNRNGEGNSRRESELYQLIEDISRQYQIIYDLHVNLRKQLAKTYDEISEEGFFTATSDSTSETSEDNDTNGSLEVGSRDQEVEDLKQKFSSVAEEKETLNSKHMEALALIKDLEAQVTSLNHENALLKEQIEHESKAVKKLQMKESDLEGLMMSLKETMQEKEDEISALRPKVKGLESELNGLEGKMREFEEQFLRKDEENSCLLVKVTKLEGMVREYENNDDSAQLSCDKELLQGRISELEKQLEDREDHSNMSVHIEALTREVNQLQQEVDVKRNDEIKKLNEEKEALEGKVLELEITLTQREDKIAKLKRKLLLAENEASTRIGLVANQMSSMQQQMNLEKEKSQETLSLLEKQNAELMTKTSDQQMKLKQQEDTINSLRADCKLAKSRLLQAADRKMEEMAEVFRKSFEANIRILRQRIRVAEQIQTENKEACKVIKERCEQEHLELEKKMQEHSRMIATSKREIVSFFNTTNEMLDGLQSLFDRFEGKEGDFSGRISGLLDEITVMKNLAKVTANEMKPARVECVTPDSNISDVDDEGSDEKLPQMNKEDKMRLMRGMYELQKKVAQLERTGAEKEEVILKLVEEKKEAIRQLCMSVEYHQNRCDLLLIKLLSKRR